MKTISKKTNLPVVHGDLFDSISKYINDPKYGYHIIVPHVCNNVNLFGAGFAAAVANRYPIVKENYHLLGSTFLKNHMGYTQFVDVTKNKLSGCRLIFANMIAQNGTISSTNPRPLNYYALVHSMANVSQYIRSKFDSDNPVQIHAPKFGCGLAGGDWNFISDLIKDIWNNHQTIIYEYNKYTKPNR